MDYFGDLRFRAYKALVKRISNLYNSVVKEGWLVRVERRAATVWWRPGGYPPTAPDMTLLPNSVASSIAGALSGEQWVCCAGRDPARRAGRGVAVHSAARRSRHSASVRIARVARLHSCWTRDRVAPPRATSRHLAPPRPDSVTRPRQRDRILTAGSQPQQRQHQPTLHRLPSTILETLLQHSLHRSSTTSQYTLVNYFGKVQSVSLNI